MAARRMFSLKIINSAKFLKMPTSSQLLYFHLAINADDDGIVEGYNVIRMIGCSEDDLKILVAKGFIIVLNEDLVSFITDWTEHNSIRADRKIDSIYRELLLQIPGIETVTKRQRTDVKKIENKPMDNQWTTNGQEMDSIGKVRLGKVRLGKVKLNKDSKNKKVIEVDLFTQALDEFKKMRKLIKKPMTDRAVNLILSNLNKFTTDKDEQILILNQSIANSWQGVFPLKEDKNGRTGKNNGTSSSDEYDFSKYTG